VAGRALFLGRAAFWSWAVRGLWARREGKTRITISVEPYNADEAGIAAFDSAQGSMEGGFAGSLAKLEAHLASLQK